MNRNAKWLSILGFSLAVTRAIAFAAPDDFGFVSSKGDDNNFHTGCTFSAPCRTFEIAVAGGITSPTAVIKALDIADFGLAVDGLPVMIPGSHTIDGGDALFSCTGTSPCVHATGGAATIRNLTFHSPGSGSGGTHIAAIEVFDGTLTLEHVRITGDATFPIVVHAGATLIAKDVTITSDNNLTIACVQVQGGSASFRDSVLDCGNQTVGAVVKADSTFPGSPILPGSLMLERTEVNFNNTGLEVDGTAGPAVARIDNCVITGNALGVYTAGSGQIISLRTNVITGNSTDGTISLSTSLK